jgi:hypothetical protein
MVKTRLTGCRITRPDKTYHSGFRECTRRLNLISTLQDSARGHNDSSALFTDSTEAQAASGAAEPVNR